MAVSEEIHLAKDIIQVFQKARKTLRMYPPNNPIYVKTVTDTHKKVEEFFELRDDLGIRIKQNEILLDNEPIYQNPEKDDNIALFFFKDGLREFTFKKGLMEDEILEFLKIISFDFDREDIDDDVVTLLWEKDFQHIKYLVDEDFLLEDENYEKKATEQVKEKLTEESDLAKAFEEAFVAEDAKGIEVVPITDRDLNALVKEMQRDSHEKMGRLIEILFEMLYHTESQEEVKDMVGILNNAVDFSVRNLDFKSAVEILERTKELVGSQSMSDASKRQLGLVFFFASSKELVKTIGRYLDSGIEISGEFSEYVKYLDKNAIPPFMTILGELKTIEARKHVINALVFLGSKDITTLAKGLSDDRWYVVRNIIYILRRIGDKRVLEYLIKAVWHNDVRVRKEVLKTLGELGGPGVIQTLKDFLGDPDPTVRATAMRALGTVGTDVAKKIILDKLSNKKFTNILDFNEKKDYFSVLANWSDGVVVDFLIRTLKKSAFFGKAKNDENRACAAYCLGLLGNRDSLSVLHKLRDSKNKLLSEYAYAAIKRIEYGK